MGAVKNRSFEQRFWERVRRAGPSECWLWQGCTDTHGYGMVRLWNRAQRSHRIAYLLTHGDFWGVLMHSCDTPLCCNPQHLTPGTRADNNRDRDRKGRHVPLRGSAHGMALLSEGQVLGIRAAFKQGATRKEIAESSRVSYVQVCRIIQEKTWRHVK
jgi:hypothetical protein